MPSVCEGGCPACQYSALCYVDQRGWKEVFTLLFWEAGKHVGLFRIDDGKLVIPPKDDEFKEHVSMAKKYWRAELLPTGCPHEKSLVNVRTHMADTFSHADVILEFHQ